MDSLLTTRSIGISTLREAPARAFEAAGDEAIVVLNHNKPAGYILSPRLMHAFLDSIADRIATDKTAQRMKTIKRARAVSLDDL